MNNHIPFLTPQKHRVLVTLVINDSQDIYPRVEVDGDTFWSIGESVCNHILFDPEMGTVTTRELGLTTPYKARTVLISHPVMKSLLERLPVLNALISSLSSSGIFNSYTPSRVRGIVAHLFRVIDVFGSYKDSYGNFYIKVKDNNVDGLKYTMLGESERTMPRQATELFIGKGKTLMIRGDGLFITIQSKNTNVPDIKALATSDEVYMALEL